MGSHRATATLKRVAGMPNLSVGRKGAGGLLSIPRCTQIYDPLRERQGLVLRRCAQYNIR